MDDFPGLLAKDFEFKPQGKPVPMAASKGTTSSRGTLNFGIGSVDESRSFPSSSNRARRDWNSNSVGNSLLDDHDDLFGSTSNQKTNDFGDLSDYNDVFGGPTKYANPPETIFLGSKESGANTSSSPVYDKPVYDDDIFDGVSGLKSSSSVNYKDVFSSMATPSKQSANFDDLLGNLGRTDAELKSSSGSRSKKVDKNVSDFEDLLPGFGGSSPPKNRATRKTSQLQQPTVPSTKSSSSVMEDPFVVLESASSYASSGLFTDDGLEQINKPSNIGSAKFDGSSVSGVFNDLDPLDGLTKSIPSFSYDMNNRGKDKNPLKKGTKTTPMHASAGEEPAEKPSLKTTGNASQKKVYKSPKSENNLEPVDDVWLTVSEIPLFTQPTSAPPPSRPPPPKPVQVSKGNNGSFSAVDTKKVNKFSTFQHSSQNFQSPKIDSDSVRNADVSSVDELEDFSMGGLRNNADERSDVLSSEEELDTNPAAASSAAAMKEAMDRAEAKFKHAREVRERENTKVGRSKDGSQQEENENAMQDSQERYLREKQERLNSEREQREREEKEREQRRRDMERERGKARQAVERATKEARDRAAIEARVKAERAAVGKANSEARGRAERAAVQRAQAEARERAASEARERAERIATESKERANAEARERASVARAEAEARERASVARAEAEARLRAERAAVDRAAAEARVRAAAVARENQKKNESDLESFFGMGARPTSAPRTRTTTPDAGFDGLFQNREVPEVPRRPSTGTPSSMRKASSTMKFGDDLTSIFGGTPSSGDFQEIDGESEERRRARLERHQRTQERAAQALAVKNQRDLQTQWDQAERHRIAETVDVEIRRWAAGKEGNLRALLSTLQYVLWPECGWQAVSLIDLIAAASVKKVYRKATLCVHPDKVQQKGASIQQKYIAEKVFDLLKEAWNKFNSEELF